MINITPYDFPEDPASSRYCVFPETLEDDDLVLFHATLLKNCDAIFREGFKIPDPTGKVGLPSVSFAKRSSTALFHAMTIRESRPGIYCIVAVRYDSFDRAGLIVNLIDIHDYTLNPPPAIIGCCIVPASYKHR